MNLSEIKITEGLSLLTVFCYMVAALNSLLLLFIPKLRHIKLIPIIIGVAWLTFSVGMLFLGSLAEKIFIIGLAIPIFIFVFKNLFGQSFQKQI
jgi:hypothetical protein